MFRHQETFTAYVVRKTALHHESTTSHFPRRQYFPARQESFNVAYNLGEYYLAFGYETVITPSIPVIFSTEYWEPKSIALQLEQTGAERFTMSTYLEELAVRFVERDGLSTEEHEKIAANAADCELHLFPCWSNKARHHPTTVN